jgi:hypothetical protein
MSSNYKVNGVSIIRDLTTGQSANAIADDGVSRARFIGLPITYSPGSGAVTNSLGTRFNCYAASNVPQYTRSGGNITTGLYADSQVYRSPATRQMPSTCNQILVYSVGGGGGGGDTGIPTDGGGGGNAGPGFNGLVAVGTLNIPAGSNFAVVVGAGGIGGNRPGPVSADNGGPSHIRFPTAGGSAQYIVANGGLGCPNGGDGGPFFSPRNGTPATVFSRGNEPGSHNAQNPPTATYNWPPTLQTTSPSGTGFNDSPGDCIGGFGGGTTNASPNNSGRAGKDGMVLVIFK